jgi:hypothetical protein
MPRAEIQNLRAALKMPSSAGRLSRLRLLLVDIERDPAIGSKRLFDGIRKGLNAILKIETLDNELLGSASRLLIRLDRVDRFKQKSKHLKQEARELAEQPAAPVVPATPPIAPGGTTPWD